jgi:hypothetical protein
MEQNLGSANGPLNLVTSPHRLAPKSTRLADAAALQEREEEQYDRPVRSELSYSIRSGFRRSVTTTNQRRLRLLTAPDNLSDGRSSVRIVSHGAGRRPGRLPRSLPSRRASIY